MKLKSNFMFIVMLQSFLFISVTLSASPGLLVESVSPNRGVAGKDLKITLTGTGFDEDTIITIFLDVEGIEPADNYACLADGDSGLTVIHPLPAVTAFKAGSLEVLSETNISVILPGPTVAGCYSLRASNLSESYELAGAVIFDEPSEDDYKETDIRVSIDSPGTTIRINTGESVNFQGSSSGGYEPFIYNWNFDGGAESSALKNPGEVIFNQDGKYTVTFTVIDDDGNSGRDKVTVYAGVHGATASINCFINTAADSLFH